VTRRRTDELSTGEWAVLALLAEEPNHGFALAKALAPEGSIGQIWTLGRPLVYRSLEVLERHDLIKPSRTEPGKGPRRTIFTVSPRGRRLVTAWLDVPVDHVRDARSLLMLKLVFLHRSGRDQTSLLEAQRSVLAEVEAALEERREALEGFERTLALWRLESTRALIRFIDAVLNGHGRRT
jgi:DNA-binding PadR family transcriptional regulator